MPSGAAVLTECLVRVGRVFGDDEALAQAERYLRGRAPIAGERPLAAAHLLSSVHTFLYGRDVVVTEGAGAEALRAVVRRGYAPGVSIVGTWGSKALMAGKQPTDDGRAQAYVCGLDGCQAPTTDPAELARQVGAPPSLG